MAIKVLIADDNEKNRKLLRILMQNQGYEVLEAQTGQQAVDIAKEALPAMILMDLRMPVMDGIAATKIIKSWKVTENIPVIVITSSAMLGDREKTILESGCDEYITKPISIKEVAAVVKKYIER